ncbi:MULTISPECIES: tyrosine-type recombinase/integrase [Methylomonas]|uniref:Preprotein translocase n=2 Tax=Methylomonas TaxID=416 RepID=A0A140E4Q2_9GAMM|nr:MULTISPECIES: integrase family protein [Methylomonas]AMK75376.1 preprotein translocase [Methylomonas denitrificans]OAI08740.1 preprotein translocase [Methylomonas methanica]TCV72469.1 site-specific recombinase XerD [Methylomonas methanica]
MATVKLSGSKIDKAQPEPGKAQTFIWDAATPGLALRITQSGGKAYIFESRFNSKTVRITIGDIKAWSLSDAQAEARRLQTLIDTGTDPRQAKAEKIARGEAAKEQAKVEAVRNSILVQRAWDEYVAKKSPRWSHHHIIDHAKVSAPGGQPKKRGSGLTVPGVLYPLLQMRMVDITADVLEQWQTQEAETRATAARHGFVLFRTFWNWCAEQKTYKAIIDPHAITKAVRDVVPKACTKKADVLQRAHLKDWFEAVRSLSNPVIAAYLQGLLLTGARREELAELKWSDIDFKLGAVWLKDKVDAEGRMIPLPPYLLSLVVALPRRNEWVFSSPSAADGKLAEPRIAHNRALDAAGLEHVTLHGLRLTFASLAEWVEMPVGVVAQIMGHKPNATAEKHYKTRPLELLAIWHGKYEAWILEQAAIQFVGAEQLQGLKLVK